MRVSRKYAMKDFLLSDCPQHENKVITSSFVVVSKQVKPKKTGEPYLALTLGDRSGHIGGLVDHVVSLFRSCDLVCRNYPQINRDLLLTGAFLHDIGKIHELTYNRSFSYTTRGQLLGHMVIELEMLHAKIAQVPGFPDELKTLVEHLIISHHGQYEFGSLKLPMFAEALMLHYLDDLDSKMESMRAHFERGTEANGAWSGYNASLGRPLLNTAKFLEKDKENKLAAAEPSAGRSRKARASRHPPLPGTAAR